MKILFAHGDVDGLCSTVVLTSVKEIDKVVFTAPYKLAVDLAKEIETNEIEEIYFTDLACTNYAVKSIIRLAKVTGKNVYYFDHHIYSLDLSDLGINYVFDKNKSCAKIVYEYFNINDSHLAKIVEIAEISDRFIKKSKLYKEAKILEDAITFNIDDNDFRIMLVEELKHKLPSDIKEVVKRAIIYKNKLNEAIKKARDNVVYEDKSKIIVMFSDSDSRKFRGCISRVAHNLLHNKELSVVIFRGTLQDFVVTIRANKRSKYNVGLIIEEIKKEFGGKGGGHEKAGSVSVSDSVVNEVIKYLKFR